MRFNILYMAVWTLTLNFPAHGAEGHRLDHECIIYVESGDSYIGLFGSDWQMVFQANSKITFYDKKGKLKHNPEKLVIGSRLVVPAGTYLTERAIERLSRYENIKNDAYQSIHEAEVFVSQASKSNSEVYEQALNLLDKAKGAARGLTFGFANFIEARRLALEAIRSFKIDRDLRKADRDMELLKERVQKDMSDANRKIRMVYQQRKAFLGIGIVMILTLLWLMRHRKKKERLIRIQGWLDEHLRRVRNLERARI